MVNDELHVVHARAAGLDMHKMEITATVRLCDGGGAPRCETRRFDALAPALAALSAWLCEHRVAAAAMEATGWRGCAGSASAHRASCRNAGSANCAR